MKLAFIVGATLTVLSILNLLTNWFSLPSVIVISAFVAWRIFATEKADIFYYDKDQK